MDKLYIGDHGAWPELHSVERRFCEGAITCHPIDLSQRAASLLSDPDVLLHA